MKATGRYSLLALFLFILGSLIGYRRYHKLTSELPVIPSYITELELLNIQIPYHTEEWPIKCVHLFYLIKLLSVIV